MAEERLQKVLAAAGVASRRAAEQLILDGRVRVDGVVVTELGTKVDPARVTLAVDGKPVTVAAAGTYIKLHKPRGILSDIGGDTRGRTTVADLLPPDDQALRLFPVGRLDLNSEGLVLLTDDGKLAHRLTHPRFEHPKKYYVLVEHRPPDGALRRLEKGVNLETGRTAPAQVAIVERLPRQLQLAPGPKAGCWLEIILHEGKKRQVRHMTAAVGFPTLRLIRWSIGPLILGALEPGATVHLTTKEIDALRRSTGGGARTGSQSKRKSTRKSGRTSSGSPPRNRRR